MREVYSKAARVVVWLDPDETEAAMAAIKLIALLHSTFNTLADNMREQGIVINNLARRHIAFENLDALLQSKEMADPWLALRALFMLPYWSRIWCVQEFHLARDVVLHFGTAQVAGKSLSSFTDIYMRDSSPQRSRRDHHVQTAARLTRLGRTCGMGAFPPPQPVRSESQYDMQ